MSGVIPWAIEALIASTLLMVLVLLLRGPVRRVFGPDIAYALWLLPALRLLLPPLPQGWWRESVAAPVSRASEQFVILVAEPLVKSGGTAAPEIHAPALGPALVLLWVVGAAAFLLWHSVAHARFCRRMLAEREGEAEIKRGIHVIETSAARGPLAFGIWRRYVAFPRDFTERYDADERDLALAHELGHHARGDLIANWAALAVLALHWFNPIAWRAFRAFRADQEIANDARVLAGRDAVTRHLYACAIVKAAHGGAVSAACHLHTIEDLKGRLRMLTTNKTSRRRLAGGVGALALIATLGLGLTASGTQAAERVRAKVEKATGVELSKLTLPAAFQSAPPAPPAPETPRTMSAPEAPPAPTVPSVGPDSRATRLSTITVHENEDDAPPSVAITADGKGSDGKYRIVVRDRQHKVIERDGVDTLADIPEIRSVNCSDADSSKETVINESHGGKKRMIICANRIEQMARHGAEIAANSGDIERNAYRHALEGLRGARERTANDASMNTEGRKEALEAIDQSIREIEEDIAKAN